MKGIDYAGFPHPSPAAIKAAGYGFVMRYTSPAAANDANGKNLQKAELTALLAAGLKVGLVFEYQAQQMLAGHAQGIADAQHADAVCKALGLHGLPVYFAADWDATQAQQAAINAYLDGAASVIGVKRTGIYAGYYPVKRALDGGHAAWAWQTLAWSGGQWDSGAHIRQHLGASVAGISVDPNDAMKDDFGQWPRPAAPVTPPPPPPASQYPVPAGVVDAVRPNVTITWEPGTPRSPHWRVQVVRDAGGKPGSDPASEVTSMVTVLPHVSLTLPGPGAYWRRVQAAGDSPFTAWQEFTA
jgi:hypothetical protein